MKIDIVIPWVDGLDNEWQKKFNENYRGINDGDANFERYRDWDLLKYWFRGIEEFAPWYNKIFFITEGHLPSWLNLNNQRLKIIKHSDYIPHQYLPTFSSHPIEIYINHIKGLSDFFIYFNDDVFLINKASKDDFFIKNKPVDSFIMNALTPGGVSHIVLNDLEVLSRHFNKKEVIKKNLFKIFNPKLGLGLIRNLLLLPWPGFTGFHDHHSAQPYLKKTFDIIWEKEGGKELMLTSRSKFRRITDINQYLFRYWQLCEGEYQVRKNKNKNAFYILTNHNVNEVCKHIENQKTTLISINDSLEVDFKKNKERLINSFNKILSKPSSFEIVDDNK